MKIKLAILIVGLLATGVSHAMDKTIMLPSQEKIEHSLRVIGFANLITKTDFATRNAHKELLPVGLFYQLKLACADASETIEENIYCEQSRKRMIVALLQDNPIGLAKTLHSLKKLKLIE